MINQPTTAPSSDDILRTLILLVAHFGGPTRNVRIPQAKIQQYIEEFGSHRYSLVSALDPVTNDVLLSLDQHQSEVPIEPAGE